MRYCFIIIFNFTLFFCCCFRVVISFLIFCLSSCIPKFSSSKHLYVAKNIWFGSNPLVAVQFHIVWSRLVWGRAMKQLYPVCYSLLLPAAVDGRLGFSCPPVSSGGADWGQMSSHAAPELTGTFKLLLRTSCGFGPSEKAWGVTSVLKLAPEAWHLKA